MNNLMIDKTLDLPDITANIEIEQLSYSIWSSAMQAETQFGDYVLLDENKKRYMDNLRKIVSYSHIVFKWERGVISMTYLPSSVEYGKAYSETLLLKEAIDDNHAIFNTYDEFRTMKQLASIDAGMVKKSSELVAVVYGKVIED